MKLELQPRDTQIMKFAFACRVVTYDQITRRHFPKTAARVARRRIRNLALQGYFKLGHIGVGDNIHRTVQPLPELWPLIGEKWPFAVDCPHYKSESPDHDVRMTELLMRFEKLKSYRSFFTENLLQSSSALANDPRFRDLENVQPDGILTVEDPNGSLKTYAVELELNKKDPERYRQKFINYYLARGIDAVLYVTSNTQIEAVVARADREIGRDRDSIVRFISEKNALAPGPTMQFTHDQEPQIDLS
jgi:hypothetical protein